MHHRQPPLMREAHPIQRFKVACLLTGMLAVSLTFSHRAHATIIYKDGSSPDGVPDITQGNDDICSRAAWANSLWFLDGRKTGGKYQWPNIVKNNDESNRKKDWYNDTRALRDDLVKRWELTEEEKQGLQRQKDEIELAGKENRPANRVYRLNRRVGEYAILDYLKDKGYAADFEMKYFGPNAKQLDKNYSYDNYKGEVEKSEDVVLYLYFYDKDGNKITGAGGAPIGHTLTAAGLDSEKKKLIVSNPHGDHDPNGEPVEKSYYNEYTIQDPDTTNGEIRITDRSLFNFAGVDNAKIAYGKVEFFKSLSPKPLAPKQRVTDSVSHNASTHTNQYNYTVANDDTSPIESIFVSLEVPVTDIVRPDGWSYTITGDYAPDHYGDPDWFIDVDGIYWYTDKIGILPGEILSGFGFSADDMFPHQEYAALATLGDSRNIQFPGVLGLYDSPNDVSNGGYLYQVFTSGPAPIPEPGTLTLLLLGVILVPVCCRSNNSMKR